MPKRKTPPMPQMVPYLRRFREPMPQWLAQFDGSLPPDMAAFLRSRVVFYPGCGSDGHALAVFGKAHAAHCFVYVDFAKWTSQDRVWQTLTAIPERERPGFDPIQQEFPVAPHPKRRQSGRGYGDKVRGYVLKFWVPLRHEDVARCEWTPHHTGPDLFNLLDCDPYVALAILEREAGYDDDHGPERLAILFVGDDGYATFDAIWCQGNGVPPPYAILAQQHGFSGNWLVDGFMAKGTLHKLATNCGALPEWILSGNGGWDPDYRQLPLSPSVGGRSAHRRWLWRRDEARSETVSSDTVIAERGVP